MDGRAAQRRTPDPIDRRPLDLEAALARLRALDPVAVARAVPHPTGPGEEAMVELVARLLDRLALGLDGAERPVGATSARAVDQPGRAGVTRVPTPEPVRR